MSTYADLTGDQKVAFDELTAQLRALAGEASRIVRRAKAIVVACQAAGIPAILQEMDADATIPNTSNLAGALPATPGEFALVYGQAGAFVQSLGSDDTLTRWAKLCGPGNVA